MLSVKAKYVNIISAAAVFLSGAAAVLADEMKPFMLASITTGEMSEQLSVVTAALTAAGFEIVGEYSPYDGARIVVVTNKALKKLAVSHERAGYLAAIRVSITGAGEQWQTACNNPSYMAAAYRVDGNLDPVNRTLKKALGFVRDYGVEEGMDEDDLAEYRYTLGMEGFEDHYKLARYGSHEEAVAAVEKGLAAHAGGSTRIYRIDLPGNQQTLFGVALSSRETGNKYMDDQFIMSEIDFKDIRSTPHLPYEILVTGGNVEALHARFRIAINFPDLSMMGNNSFMNIMPSPDAIRKSLTLAAGGKPGQNE